MAIYSINIFSWVYLFSILLLYSCYQKPNRESKIFVSETFQNRFVDDGTTQIHNSDDEGFYSNHFGLTSIVYKSNAKMNIDTLRSDTGISWSEISTFDSVLNFKNFINPNINRVIYVLEYLYKQEADDRILTLGSDDGIRVWLNGEEVYSRNVWRGIKANNDFVKINFREGWNTLMYKVSQGDGGWGLYRNFRYVNDLKAIIRSNAYDIYNDLIESTIIDEDSPLTLKIDPRSNTDSFNTMNILITDISSESEEDSYIDTSFSTSKIPEQISLPKSFSGKGKFSVSITENSDVIFSESIPFFYAKEFESVKKTVQIKSYENEIGWAKKNALLKLYEKGNKASTRMRSEALWDVLSYNSSVPDITPGFNILGYRSKLDGSIQTYTLLYPGTASEYPLIYIMHGEYNKDSDYWNSYEGGSHSIMVARIAESIDNDVAIAMTHGRGIKNYLDGAEEELPLINDQLKDFMEIESSHILVWSRGATSLFELLKIIEINIESVGIISPFVPDDEVEMQQLISYIKLNYPDLKWFIRHGLNDEDSPISRTRKFVKLLGDNGITVNYKEIPYSTHWNYIYDQEKEYYRFVKAN